MDKNDLDTMIHLHFLKVRAERTGTEAVIWLLRLAVAVLIATIVWVTYTRISPHYESERFYSAACKLNPADLPRSVLAECAVRKKL